MENQNHSSSKCKEELKVAVTSFISAAHVFPAISNEYIVRQKTSCVTHSKRKTKQNVQIKASMGLYGLS